MLNSDENKNRLISGFPNLKTDPHFEITDGETPNYNCIANAACIFDRWWQPLPEDERPLHGLDGVIYDWPYDAPYNSKLETYMYIFEKKGYQKCEDGSYEEGFRKVCFYGIDENNVKHAARQLVVKPHVGVWTSKMGASFRIHHGEPESVESASYGKILGFMKAKWP